jgi:molybdate-binding protein/DNA-binding XRE family transcriptional regulator
MSTPQTADPLIENRLRQKRQALGLSQKQLAGMAGVTRQAVAAVEANHYSPSTSVALQFARALQCRVEDLFSIKNDGEMIQAELLGHLPKGGGGVRAQVTQVNGRLFIRALDGAGELKSLTASADGLIVGADCKRRRVKVRLLKNRDAISRHVAVGGCDPAMFLAAEHLGSHDLVPCVMGNSAALAALRRGEIHVAGIHLVDEGSRSWNLRRQLRGLDCIVVTFAHWEEGIMVSPENPKRIRTVADLSRPTVKMVNREQGSGARRLLDRELQSAGIPSARVKGYRTEVLSHLDIASHVRAGLADAGIGVRAAATICGLGFIPLQRERYDLVIPKMHYQSLPALRNLLDLIVCKSFRAELEALGGYDTRETGKVVEPHPSSRRRS